MFFRSPEISRRERLERIRSMTEKATDLVIDHLKKHGSFDDVVVPIGHAPRRATPESIVDNVGMGVIRGIQRVIEEREINISPPDLLYDPVQTIRENDADMHKGIPHGQELVIVLSTREGVPAGLATS